MQRVADGVESIDGHRAQVENGRDAKHQVKAVMDLAEREPEIPAVFHRPDHTVRHDGESQKEVGDGHGENEEVGGRVKLLEVGNGNDHGQVAEDRDEDGSCHQ